MKNLLLLIACLGIAGVTGVAMAEEPIMVTLDRPDPFAPAYGNVEIAAVVSAAEVVERVVFYVDGMVVGELKKRDPPRADGEPWSLWVELGDDVNAHRFEAVAYGASGKTGSGLLLTPALRVDDEVAIRLQQLYVTATDGNGTRVLDLQGADFDIRDNGGRQSLVTFARGDVPFTAVVLVDASVSMQGAKLRAALAGAKAFFEGMRPLDEGRLMAFSDRLMHGTPYTSFPEILTAGLGNVRADGGTALNDHLYLALSQLESRQGRRVVLILSDGVDSHSVLNAADVLAAARRSQALIYWLRLPYKDGGGDEIPRLSTVWRNADDYEREIRLFESTVLESGGRITLLTSIDMIDDAFRGILGELRDQYVLGYYPAAARQDGRWREVDVRTLRRGIELRARGGYFDLP